MFSGEHILAFASCTGNEEIISMLLKAGANIRAQDSFGKCKIRPWVISPRFYADYSAIYRGGKNTEIIYSL